MASDTQNAYNMDFRTREGIKEANTHWPKKTTMCLWGGTRGGGKVSVWWLAGRCIQGVMPQTEFIFRAHAQLGSVMVKIHMRFQ